MLAPFTWWRSALRAALALLLFLVLCPTRVCAGRSGIASRSLPRTRRVRTDLLVSVRCLDGVCRRLLLKHALGGQVETDPQVLVHYNPDPWHRLDEDAQQSAALGHLVPRQATFARQGVTSGACSRRAGRKSSYWTY
ncbi:hypothetical protein AB0A61_07000, partial [Streptomyces sp. NPDC046197]